MTNAAFSKEIVFWKHIKEDLNKKAVEFEHRQINSYELCPLHYIRKDESVFEFVSSLLGDHASHDSFLRKAEEYLLLACCYYIIKEIPSEERTLMKLVEILHAGIPEDYSFEHEYFCPNLEALFSELAIKTPYHIAHEYYMKYLLATGYLFPHPLVIRDCLLHIFSLY